MLDEFTRVVDAARGAVEIQKEFKTKNAELPENRRIEFLICPRLKNGAIYMRSPSII